MNIFILVCSENVLLVRIVSFSEFGKDYLITMRRSKDV